MNVKLNAASNCETCITHYMENVDGGNVICKLQNMNAWDYSNVNRHERMGTGDAPRCDLAVQIMRCLHSSAAARMSSRDVRRDLNLIARHPISVVNYDRNLPVGRRERSTRERERRGREREIRHSHYGNNNYEIASYYGLWACWETGHEKFHARMHP